MKYIIKRTSIWGNARPCEKKDMELITLKKYKDIRGFDNKETWLSRFPEDNKKVISWGITKKGKPYRIVDGSHISFWTIEIKDLEKFLEEYGECVISSGNEEYVGYTKLLQLEIYDDYRE